MDGQPTIPPDELDARQLAFGYNFMPEDILFYDELNYTSGARVFHFATGNRKVNIEFLFE